MENCYPLTQKDSIFVGSRLYIPANEIMILNSDVNYTYIFLESGKKHLLAYTLWKVANKIEPHIPLFRVNRSTIINLNYLKKFDGNFVVLKNKKVLQVSRRRKKALNLTLQNRNISG